ELVELEQLPLTPNGKVDRRALPVPDLAGDAEEEPPRNALEELLVAIWREVLERQAVGIHQNFFHLGGHSLLATQVVSRIAKALQVELPVRVIFEAPTVARLAEAVRGAQQAAQSSLPGIPRQVSSARAAELLAQLDQLSDAEVEQLLQDPEVKSLLS
ncbi:MAG TPA: phosphopantetheine-binding protein, partial [Candidatus Sulfotelmatobacter sp.]|nr:phosphopantetheine-binding protein [Candidatus Sulfotelmatobacter sp.]